MNPLWGHVAGIFIVVMMTTFIGIWIWAWRKRHRSSFKRMSELPMEDKPESPAPGEPRTGADKNDKGRQP